MHSFLLFFLNEIEKCFRKKVFISFFYYFTFFLKNQKFHTVGSAPNPTEKSLKERKLIPLTLKKPLKIMILSKPKKKYYCGLSIDLAT